MRTLRYPVHKRVRIEFEIGTLSALSERAYRKGLTLSKYIEKLVEEDRQKFLY